MAMCCCVFHGGERKANSLVVLDAQSMKELGRERMPIIMGYGFHGMFAG